MTQEQTERYWSFTLSSGSLWGLQEAGDLCPSFCLSSKTGPKTTTSSSSLLGLVYVSGNGTRVTRRGPGNVFTGGRSLLDDE